MRRLNVRFSQIEECIRTSLFAVDSLPRNPELRRGEPLLLQLVKADAERLGKLDARVEFALIFDHVEEDPTGVISRTHWPDAGKVWRYILVCSETIPTIPFSLERLPLSRDYGGQVNAMLFDDPDEEVVRPYLKGEVAFDQLSTVANVHTLLKAIRNHDLVAALAPVRTSKVSEHRRRFRDPWLPDALKLFYEHKCQVCTHDFTPRYGLPYADTRFLQSLERGGELSSRNVVVLCPNHGAIIGAASARFDRDSLTFVFPNGLRERLLLRDHLLG